MAICPFLSLELFLIPYSDKSKAYPFYQIFTKNLGSGLSMINFSIQLYHFSPFNYSSFLVFFLHLFYVLSYFISIFLKAFKPLHFRNNFLVTFHRFLMWNTLNIIFSYPKVICNFSFGFKIFYPNSLPHPPRKPESLFF